MNDGLPKDIIDHKIKALSTIMWDLTTKLHADGQLTTEEDCAIKGILSDGPLDEYDLQRYNECVSQWIERSNNKGRVK